MTASVIIGIVAMILLTATSITIAVISRQSAADAIRLVETMSALHDRNMSGLLDRFQAIRWEDLAAFRSIEEDVEGGQFIPGEDQEETIKQTVPHRWGPLRVEPPAADDTDLVDEDFPRSTG